MSKDAFLEKAVIALGLLSLLMAVLRLFVKSWGEPVGVPVWIGSFLASLTVVLLLAIFLLFRHQASMQSGRYWRAAVAYLILAAWCELLVMTGIWISDRFGLDSYYRGPWVTVEETFPTASAHILGHMQGFLFRTVVGLLIGALVFGLVRRKAKSLFTTA